MQKINKSAAVAIELAEAASAWSQHNCCQNTQDRLGLIAVRLGRSDNAPVMTLTRKSSNLYYNRVIGLGMARPARERQLDDAIKIARHAGIERFAIDLSPRATPRHLERWLSNRGFSKGSLGGKLWRDDRRLPSARAQGPQDEQIVVKRVSRKHASEWVDVVSQVWRAFGSRREWFESRVASRDWWHYLAFIETDLNTPIAAGALFIATVEPGGGQEPVKVGHLMDGVSLSPFRRLGAQSAVIRRRLRDGKRAGCVLFTSETAPPLPRQPKVSFRNLKRQGFDLAYLRQSWIFRS